PQAGGKIAMETGATSISQQGGGGLASPRYQSLLVALLGVNMGIVFLDRNAFNLLAPMIQPEFGLSNTQIGMITGILAATWALSSFGLNRLADITGKSKMLLVVATIVFSLASISSGLAVGFLTLLAARALMGLAEGGLPPLSTHIVSSEVAPERRGLAIGVLSTVGINAIPMLGPIVIVGIGTLYGWREAFWIAGVPGLILAGLIWMFVRNPPRNALHEDAPKGSVIPLLKVRNIRFTMALATLNMTFFAGFLGFGPLYLVNVLGLSNEMMGIVLTSSAAAGIFFGFFFPMLSDRVGRRPAIISSFLVAALGTVLLATSDGNLALVFIGAMLAGAGSTGSGILIMVVIPGESAPPHLKATAMGFNAAVGEMLGAGAMPIVIGLFADEFGLSILPWFLLVVIALLVAVTLGLRETAPRLVERAAAAPA
ncbi:MAG TPA: MFS transporter, partial [Sphingomonadaceae bacterium]|nr:MFS transporter [Sphingomonadaceae bacterium]